MTNDEQLNPGAAPHPPRKPLRLLCATALWLAALPALAQTAPIPSSVPPATASENAVAAEKAATRSRADAAATATLAALLPHLAANDAIPLMDRSAMFAGDLSRLLANYDVSQSAANAAQNAVADSKVQVILQRAMALLGTPYVWGGESTEGFDCSGLVGYVFKTALGIELPRVSRDIARDETAELIKDPHALKAGDLVFFGRRGRIDHVGLVVGDGKFLHAPSRGKDVRVDSLASGYWSEKFIQARRVL
ncbi:C40 family peptidase [Xanthomonas campestris]|uniref:C40 family peptidase n=1 Tax=Xanthomonas campestris TaxID=339 RepID=UPI000E32BB88|nr:C40 family peptidase [Xanthomonas campestris]MCC5064460.1 C40 family peptidase [Xanthomonas campestris pv. raphani]MCC8485405.1 C40 family peptidase [Xanthomonas campestris]MCC8685120.1 C40 family peptidase [Xanthomonas campestris]MCC8689636.1 C40 family peptidase [Xanthomonas campestris]MCW1998939.1 cell wall-associated NlpC family hydrolase [Xanthomonas campestris]